MEISRLLSLKDFFNYFIAGIVWVLDFILISLFFGAQPDYLTIVNFAPANNVVISTFVSITLSIIIPYSVGFVLSKLGNFVTKLIRDRFGEPRHWLLDYSGEGKSRRFRGRRLPKPMVEHILGIAPHVFGYRLRDAHLWFYQIRAYVTYKGGPASDLANRARDLANFAESLLLPLPLLLATVSYYIASNISIFLVRIGIAGMIFLIFFYLLLKKYQELHVNAIKHIYRAFLIMATEELRQAEQEHKDQSKMVGGQQQRPVHHESS